jgi:hypothetical protein
VYLHYLCTTWVGVSHAPYVANCRECTLRGFTTQVRAHGASGAGSTSQNGAPQPIGLPGEGMGVDGGQPPAATAATAAAPVTITVRSERLSTLGVQEEDRRNADMSNFIGACMCAH